MPDDPNKPEDIEIEKDQFENRNESPEPTMSPVKAAFIALISVFLLYQIGGSIMTLLIFGLDLKNADMNALRLLTAAGQILLILAPALIFAKLVFQDVTTIIRVKIPYPKEIGLFIIGLALLIPLLQSYLNVQNYLLNLLADNSSFFSSIKNFLDTINKFVEETYTDLLHANNAFEIILIIIVVSVVPAVCEEVFFRGFVLKSFEYKFSPIISSLITAVFFGVYHFNPYGLLALIALGTYLGYAAYKSNSIVIPIILHFLNNFVAITAFFIFGSEDFMEAEVITSEDAAANGFIFLIILFLFVAFTIGVNRYYKNNNNVERRNGYDLP